MSVENVLRHVMTAEEVNKVMSDGLGEYRSCVLRMSCVMSCQLRMSTKSCHMDKVTVCHVISATDIVRSCHDAILCHVS